jgi:hypothetical protein
MDREKCVVCENKLELLVKRENVPITFSPPSDTEPFEKDIFSDQHIGVCKECGCVQLMKLIDPEILYSSSHNGTFNTETWKQHHQQFFEFVCNNNTTLNILEIGGNPEILYPKFEQKYKELSYQILDICIPSTDNKNIKYITGNCESFKYESDTDIVMSHVFEHLYNPLEFIKCLQESGVKRVYISIPNMDHLLAIRSPLVICNEHTYFVNDAIIKSMFANHGFKCVSFEKFKNHSYFFYFEKLPKASVSISEEIMNIFKLSPANPFLNPTLAGRPIFIAPAGHYGQHLYNIFKPDHIQGFLDNDIYKQGKRVYGTPKYAFGYDELKKHENPHVFVFAGPYTNEIVKQLQSSAMCTVEVVSSLEKYEEVKACVIVQGKIYKAILQPLLDTYKDYPHKILSTWDTEDKECINILKNNGFHIVIQSVLSVLTPANYQAKSMLGGIHKAKELGFTHAFRVRADVRCNNIAGFMKLMTEKYSNRLSDMAFYRNVPNVSEPYMLDHFLFGSLEDQYNYWNVFQCSSDTRYSEKFLMETYFKKENVTYDDVKEKVDFFIEDAQKLCIEFYYTKPEYINHQELVANYLIHHSRK